MEEHPDFSYHGHKGIIALTGYNGILGYRTDIAYKTRKDLDEYQEKFFEENPDFDKAAWKKERQQAKKVADAMKEAGIVDTVQNTEFPVIVRRMKDENGKRVWFYFNYSHTPAEAVYAGADGVYLMKEDQIFPEINVAAGEKLALGSWDVQIIREK